MRTTNLFIKHNMTCTTKPSL